MPFIHQKLFLFGKFEVNYHVLTPLFLHSSERIVSIVKPVLSEIIYQGWNYEMLTLKAPTPQNGQTHRDNSSASGNEFFWVCLTIFLGLVLKAKIWLKKEKSLSYLFSWFYTFVIWNVDQTWCDIFSAKTFWHTKSSVQQNDFLILSLILQVINEHFF